ncbi:MAG: trehalase family glycosidase, partial [Cyclobacteriaceae bacterium]|nr:trehalase family glycosidase [Cyclobacteriaceae bacterium]
HVTRLWSVLKRPADKRITGTLIPLPYPYIVPGDRFREIYYWDSYFTMLGLQADNQIETIRNMIDNFSYLIDTLGFIPNGNRTYYLGRSQPPFYAAMVSLLAESQGDSVLLRYRKYMEKEYAFWMDGAEQLNDTKAAFRRVVRLPDGEILNRYWDDNATPRAESYLEDVKTADEAVTIWPDTKREDVLRNLRAAAESGWDFSSRWLSQDKEGKFQLYTIHTTDILPVDLNALLYNLEYTLWITYELNNDLVKADQYKIKCEARRKAIAKYCWNKKKGFFMDFNFREGAQTEVFSIAGMYPMFFLIADQQQAEQVAKKINDSFLQGGGVPSTLNNTGQQWDAPNGWAPLEWITIKGLRNYGFHALAGEIKQRWLALNQKVYINTYKFIEKYNVEDLSKEGGGGEYPNQDGFGWTNGVFQKLSKETDVAVGK